MKMNFNFNFNKKIVSSHGMTVNKLKMKPKTGSLIFLLPMI